MSRRLFAACLLLAAAPARSADFKEKYCTACHNGVAKTGGLDLTTFPFNPTDSANFAQWVKVHDRVRAGEMPPRPSKTAPMRRSGRRSCGSWLAA